MARSPLPRIGPAARIAALALLAACRDPGPTLPPDFDPVAALPPLQPPALDDVVGPREAPIDLRGITWLAPPRPLPPGTPVFAPAPEAWTRWQGGIDAPLRPWMMGEIESSGDHHAIVRFGAQLRHRYPTALLLAVRGDEDIPHLATGMLVLAPRDGVMTLASVAGFPDGHHVDLWAAWGAEASQERQFRAPRPRILPLATARPGAFMLCADAEATRLYRILYPADPWVLALDGTDRPALRDRALCAPLDPTPPIHAGLDQAWAFVFGALRPVRILHVSLEEARVRVTFPFVRRRQHTDLPLSFLMLDVPAFGVWSPGDVATPMLEPDTEGPDQPPPSP
jgi:hypothetical protein